MSQNPFKSEHRIDFSPWLSSHLSINPPNCANLSFITNLACPMVLLISPCVKNRGNTANSISLHLHPAESGFPRHGMWLVMTYLKIVGNVQAVLQTWFPSTAQSYKPLRFSLQAPAKRTQGVVLFLHMFFGMSFRHFPVKNNVIRTVVKAPSCITYDMRNCSI